LHYFYSVSLFNVNTKILYFDILWVDQSPIIVTHHSSLFPIVKEALIWYTFCFDKRCASGIIWNGAISKKLKIILLKITHVASKIEISFRFKKDIIHTISSRDILRGIYAWNKIINCNKQSDFKLIIILIAVLYLIVFDAVDPTLITTLREKLISWRFAHLLFNFYAY
jgi:hypothetical protein